MLLKYRLVWPAAGSVIALTVAGGQVINWQNRVIGDSVVDSGGAEVASTFSFELGAFVNGFTPTAENTDLWEANWQAIDQSGEESGVSYVPGSGGFGDTHNYTLEDSAGSMGQPGVGGLQAYVWGFDSRSGGGEWILFTQTGTAEPWILPAVGNVADGTTFNYNLDEADTVVLGSITDLSATSTRFQTVAVPEPSAALLALVSLAAAAFRTRSRHV